MEWDMYVCGKGHRQAVPKGQTLPKCLKTRCRGKVSLSQRKR